MRLTRLLPLAAAACLAACADSPTAPLAPGAASFEEGNYATGGNRTTNTGTSSTDPEDGTNPGREGNFTTGGH